MDLTSEFIQPVPEIFAERTTVNEHGPRIRDLEQLLDKKEVRIVLPKDFLGPERLGVKAKVTLGSWRAPGARL